MHFIKISAFFLLALTQAQFGACQDEPGAVWIPSPHITRGRSSGNPKYLILHGTAGGSSAEGICRWFQDPSSQVSTHYAVDQQGVVAQCVAEKDTAWANGRVESGADSWWSGTNPNALTISIEHVKSSSDNSNELTEAQSAASFNLIKNILRRNPGIKPIWAKDSTGGITGHFSMSPQSRARCPGPFPWSEMFSAIGNTGGPYCIGTVTATALNIRSGPNTGSGVVKSLNFGHQFMITERVDGESVNGNTGWFKTAQGYASAYYVSVRAPKPNWCVV